MNASRSFQVIAAKRRHSFPPIWLKMILVNLPSAVRRAAFARTPVAALAVAFGRLTAARAFVALFVFMVASLLGLGRYHTWESLRSKQRRSAIFGGYAGQDLAL